MLQQLQNETSNSFSPQSLRKIVQRFILKSTIEALLKAEVLAAQTADSGEITTHARRIRTGAGKVKIDVPRAQNIGQQIIARDGHQLKVDTSEILALSLCNDEEMQRCLTKIYGAPAEPSFIEVIREHLSSCVSSLPSLSLKTSVQEIYLGSVDISDQSDASDLKAAYVISVDEMAHPELIDLRFEVDPKITWLEICQSLRERGYQSSMKIVVDDSFGLGGALPCLFGDPDESSADAIEITGNTEQPEADPSVTILSLEASSPTIEGNLHLGPIEISRHNSSQRNGYWLVAGAATLMLLTLTAVTVAPKRATELSAMVVSVSSPKNWSENVAEDVVNVAAVEEPLTEVDLTSAVLTEVEKLSAEEDYVARIEAIRGLKERDFGKTPAGLNLLSRLLNDQEYLVRGYAAKTLGAIGSEESIQLLQTRSVVEGNDVVRMIIGRFTENRG